MAVKYVESFDFPNSFGFSGSSIGRHDAKDHPLKASDEYGDGSYLSTMKAGGRVKKAMGGTQNGMPGPTPAVGALGASMQPTKAMIPGRAPRRAVKAQQPMMHRPAPAATTAPGAQAPQEISQMSHGGRLRKAPAAFRLAGSCPRLCATGCCAPAREMCRDMEIIQP